MKAAVKIILGTQILLALIWIVPMLGIPDNNLVALQLFVMSFSVQTLFFFFAIWVFWRHPEERNKAAAIMLLPVISFFLPGVVQSAAGGPLSGPAIAAVFACVLIAVLLAGAFYPRKAAGLIPSVFFRSDALNLLIVVVVVIAWIFPFASIFWLFSDYSGDAARSMQRSNDGYVFAYLFFAGAIYFGGLAVASFCTLVWAWIGLKAAVEGGHRKLHITQLALSVPGLVAGILYIAWAIKLT